MSLLQCLVVTTKSITMIERDDMPPFREHFGPFVEAETLKLENFCLRNVKSIIFHLFSFYVTHRLVFYIARLIVYFL